METKNRVALLFIPALTLLSIITLVALLQQPHPAGAAPNGEDWFVNAATGSDDNSCLEPGEACATIQAAIEKAAAGDTINIESGIYLESDIIIGKGLTLFGRPTDNPVVDAQGNGRLFHLTNGTHLVEIHNLILQNGAVTIPSTNFLEEAGGAVRNQGHTWLNNVVISNSTSIDGGPGGGVFNSGTLTITNSTIQNNTSAANGGGVANYRIGTLTIINTRILDNTANGIQGGGINADGTVFLQDVTVEGNEATSFGGGIASNESINEANLTLDRVTLHDNFASSGGAIFSNNGTITGTNVTVSGNTAQTGNGGIYLTGANAHITLQNSTVAYNGRLTNPGSVQGLSTGSNATATLVNTILAHNDGTNCSNFTSLTQLTSLGHNLSDDASCNLAAAGDQQERNPLLLPLDDYSGNTWTHALQPNSPAIDAGDNANCAAVDQRGITRPYDGDNDTVATCDIGAVEAIHQLEIDDIRVTEGSGGTTEAVFTVTLSPESAQTVSVNYMTVENTAVAPADFTAANGTLTFPPGTTSRTITITINADTTDEPDERFGVRLGNPGNAGLLDRSGIATIIDDDGLPSLSIDDLSGIEGDIANEEMGFTVTLSPAVSDVVTVTYTSVPGTAVAGLDYTAVSGTLVFPENSTAQTIPVTILADIIDEGDTETFSIILSNPENAQLSTESGAATGTGTIIDNDRAVLDIEGTDLPEGNSGTTPAAITVTLSTPSAETITVSYEIETVSTTDPAPATPGVDFTGDLSGNLTFAPGETEKIIPVQIVGDEEPELDERFFVRLSNGSAPLTNSGFYFDILNDDGGDDTKVYDHFIYLPYVQKETN